MTSFIELPRLGYGGIDQASLYVNVDDIVCFEQDFDGQTIVTVRAYGSEGHGRVRTYVPLGALRNALEEMATDPGTRSWRAEMLKGWSVPLKALLQDQRDRERNVYSKGI